MEGRNWKRVTLFYGLHVGHAPEDLVLIKQESVLNVIAALLHMTGCTSVLWPY